MKENFKKITKLAIVTAVIFLGLHGSLKAMAIGTGLTVSPMFQRIIVNPGEKQEISFRIANPAAAVKNVYYDLSVEPFYINESGELVYQAEGEMSEMMNWVEFNVPTEGKLEPNEVKDIVFTINAPKSAPAGGQYFSVMVTEKDSDEHGEGGGSTSEEGRGTTMREIFKMAHLIYAEVTGSVIKQGEIKDVSLPGFFLSGNITGSASVKNTGNVHGDATYTMQVFPLFSDEEIYTNEENPETVMILPNRASYHTTSWDNTPVMGIFNVVYTVKFGDSMQQISKMVIVCPLWLLFVIFFVIAALIIWIVMRIKANNKRKAES